MQIPEHFGEEFVLWFRQRMEESWRSRGERMRWNAGLSETRIEEFERSWSLKFPPDHRLFLRWLHCAGQPRCRGNRLGSDGGGAAGSSPGFYNWSTDREPLQRAFAWPLDGLYFDIDHNSLWFDSWGKEPETVSAKKRKLRRLISSAPLLIPIAGHRYLLGEPCRAGNPVLSVYQSDIICYGSDLRHYLLIEFAGRLGLDRDVVFAEAKAANACKLQNIPFWGDFLA